VIVELITTAAANQGHTLLRVIGDVILHANNSQDGNHEGMAGLVMQSGEAIAAGATFEPRSDPAEWLWQEQWHKHMFGTNLSTDVMRTHLDVKAKRRITSQNGLYLVFERGPVGPVDMTGSVHVRTLIALP